MIPMIPRNIFMWYGYYMEFEEMTELQQQIFQFSSSIHIGIL